MTGAKEGAVVVRWGYWLGDRGIFWEIGTETQEFWLGNVLLLCNRGCSCETGALVRQGCWLTGAVVVKRGL